MALSNMFREFVVEAAVTSEGINLQDTYRIRELKKAPEYENRLLLVLSDIQKLLLKEQTDSQWQHFFAQAKSIYQAAVSYVHATKDKRILKNQLSKQKRQEGFASRLGAMRQLRPE